MKTKRAPTSDLEAIIPLLIAAWRRLHKESGPADKLQTREFRRVVAAIQSLQKHLSSTECSLDSNYLEDPELRGAYLLYHWIIHYQQGLSLLGELPQPPTRVLDVCSGLGSFAFAALRHGAEDVTMIDQSDAALKMGAEIAGRYGYPVNTRLWNGKEALPVEGEFDLIILGHCLKELFPSSNKQSRDQERAFIQKLLKRLSPNGFLLIVDTSHVETNRRILELRDQLVSEGVPVQAPCVWKGACPALQIANSPCYAQRELEKPFLIKEFQRAAQINLSSLKMTYILFRSPKAKWPVLQDEAMYRVISPPVESFHGKRYYLCGTDGKKNLGSHLTEHPVESRAFEYLQRGVLISISDGLEKPHSLDIVKGTQVTVKAACGKPLREEVLREEV